MARHAARNHDSESADLTRDHRASSYLSFPARYGLTFASRLSQDPYGAGSVREADGESYISSAAIPQILVRLVDNSIQLGQLSMKVAPPIGYHNRETDIGCA